MSVKLWILVLWQGTLLRELADMKLKRTVDIHFFRKPGKVARLQAYGWGYHTMTLWKEVWRSDWWEKWAFVVSMVPCHERVTFSLTLSTERYRKGQGEWFCWRYNGGVNLEAGLHHGHTMVERLTDEVRQASPWTDACRWHRDLEWERRWRQGQRGEGPAKKHRNVGWWKQDRAHFCAWGRFEWNNEVTEERFQKVKDFKYLGSQRKWQRGEEACESQLEHLDKHGGWPICKNERRHVQHGSERVVVHETERRAGCRRDENVEVLFGSDVDGWNKAE